MMMMVMMMMMMIRSVGIPCAHRDEGDEDDEIDEDEILNSGNGKSNPKVQS